MFHEALAKQGHIEVNSKFVSTATKKTKKTRADINTFLFLRIHMEHSDSKDIFQSINLFLRFREKKGKTRRKDQYYLVSLQKLRDLFQYNTSSISGVFPLRHRKKIVDSFAQFDKLRKACVFDGRGPAKYS